MLKSDKKFTFIIKKTNELDSDEINQINRLFNKTFDKKRTEEEFKKKFLNNFFNFSFHGLMKLEDTIVGCYHVVPYEFTFFSEKKLFGQSVDTTIHSDFRGNIYNLKKLAKKVYDEIKKNNIFFVYGLPNEKFYLVKKKVLGWRDLGKLNYYVYPNSLQKFYKKFFPINILLTVFLKFLINIKIKKKSKYKFSVYKINNENFNKSRYNDNKDYKFVYSENYKLIYKIVKNEKYNDARILYIIDIFPLTQENLEKSIKELKRLETSVDMIIYIGKLKTTPDSLLRIPDFFLKKQTYVSGIVLDSGQINDRIFNIFNWNINLSNFDIK